MKKWMNDKYTTIAIYVLLVLLAAILFFFSILNFGKIYGYLSALIFSAKSVLFGALIALTLFPLSAKLEGWLRRRTFRKKPLSAAFSRTLSVILASAVAVLCIAGIVFSIIPMIHQNYDELQKTLLEYMTRLLNAIQQNQLLYNLILTQVGVTGSTVPELFNNILLRYSDLISSVANNLVSSLSVIITNVSDVVVAFILAVYFLIARDRIRAVTRKLAVAVFPGRFLVRMARFFQRFYTNIMEFISARLVCSLALGVLCYLLTWALNVPFFPVISLIALFLNILPVIGPVIAALLCTLIVFVVQPEVTWLFLLIFLVLNLVEQYLIERSLLSKRLRPNAAVGLIMVLLAYYFTGFLGAVLAIPVFSTLVVEVRYWLNRRLRKKGLPTVVEAYVADAPLPGDAAVASAPADEEEDEKEEDMLPAKIRRRVHAVAHFSKKWIRVVRRTLRHLFRAVQRFFPRAGHAIATGCRRALAWVRRVFSRFAAWLRNLFAEIRTFFQKKA